MKEFRSHHHTVYIDKKKNITVGSVELSQRSRLVKGSDMQITLNTLRIDLRQQIKQLTSDYNLLCKAIQQLHPMKKIFE